MDSLRRVIRIGLGMLLAGAPVVAQSQPAVGTGATPRAGVVVPAEVALGSLVALGDGYLQKFADSFTLFALREEARSANWALIKAPLADVASRNVDALVWFALPDGTYWSVEGGKSGGNLSDRPYFPRVLSGETILGTLVVSKATGRASAIVAVPVRNDAGVVVGVLGASIYLDQLSARLQAEMAIGENLIFYSFDATPLLALEWDPKLILVDPLSLGPEVRAVFEYMLSHETGTVRYRWTNQWRTALFRHSRVSGWWYVFGVVGGSGAAR
jgi:hypothetical protein